MIGRDAQALARDFWTCAGGGESFPRPIEQAVSLALPVTVVRLAAVDAGHVARQLFRYGVAARLPDDGRQLMGCLVAHRGSGIVFVDGGDDACEQRLTIAHEAAHFIVDYLLPRDQVIAAMGPSAVDVLDGVRPATVAERATAVLAHVRLGPHVHLLARQGDDGEESDAGVATAESRADALAIELLAPRDRVAPYLQRAAGLDAKALASLAGEMAAHFGLPAHVVDRQLRAAVRPRPRSFLADALSDVREARR